jgi:cell division septation protein DedD
MFKSEATDSGDEVATRRATRLIERDIEAPEVFQVTEAGLWDGRPSLGGVWVAHPDVKEPERVLIRNTANDKFVIGALFRRERENPGPRVQVSSDAAAALGMLAGAPQNLNVTALRREEAPKPAEAAAENVGSAAPAADPAAQGAEGGAMALAAPEVNTVPLASPAAPAAQVRPQPASVPAAPAPKPAASSLTRPYLQIGIFSVEENARNTATAMSQQGMVPTVRKQSSKGKTFWRVLIGPATTESERDALLDKVKATGFTDAYAVTN